MKIRNLAWIRNLSVPDIPDFGARLYQAFHSISTQASTTEEQGNLNPKGQPQAPPAIQGLSVTGQNGFFNVAIQDQTPGLKRGVQYYAEHADNPGFTNPQIIHLGDTRNHTVALGNVTRYWRAYSSYSSSPSSPPAYHGSQSAPLAVSGGGPIGGPDFQPSQGSGTGAPGVGLSGPGPVPVRSLTAGYDWTAQRGRGTDAGFSGSGTPAGDGALSSPQTIPPLIGTNRWIIEDTLAHQGNYAPKDYPGALYVATDTLIVYYSSGVSWIAIEPSMGGASYPTHDVNGVFPDPMLTATGVGAGSYGDSTHTVAITVDAKGRVSAASSVAIAFPGGFSGTVPLGPLTGGGTAGSITFVNGRATAAVNPT